MKRPVVATALVLSALLAACGSTVQSAGRPVSGGDELAITDQAVGATDVASSGGELAATTATTASAGTNNARTATTAARSAATKAATGPIEIGFVNTGVSNASALGVKFDSNYTSQQIYEALVTAMNKTGGINGRPIKAVYANTDTASASWNADFQAVCEKFTRDNKVVAVLGYVFIWLDAFEACLAKAGVVHLYGGYQPGDRQAQREHPFVVATTHPDGENAWLTAMGGAIATGHLTPSKKLGIMVDSCGHSDRAFEAVVPAYLRARRITFEMFDMGCSSGSTDNGKAAADIQAAALRFRSRNVDTVYVGGVPALLFATHAESQGWRPSYIMNVAGAAFEGNVPAAQLRNFHGFGWIPSVDVNGAHQPAPPNATQKKCLSMLAGQGIQPASGNDFMLAYTSCDALFLYASALKVTNGRSDGRAVVQALTTVGPSYESTSTYAGRVQFSGVQRGGAAIWREWGYAENCSCFVYKGDARPLSW